MEFFFVNLYIFEGVIKPPFSLKLIEIHKGLSFYFILSLVDTPLEASRGTLDGEGLNSFPFLIFFFFWGGIISIGDFSWEVGGSFLQNSYQPSQNQQEATL